VIMRKAFEWFDQLAPNHMLWAVGVYGIIMTFIVTYIHFVL